ncbi:glycosyltransferase family 4 protein [Azospirillum sp. TSO22-1]|uniref:glycosyltransferase family 4 protein n=1 Tax=Azospirillum sp. TSO22-1 TaxID=716789 RepID=UPI000D64347B|nr:glycosyltransferase family 4 protein [Azospirillum sp. TSO22-1]
MARPAAAVFFQEDGFARSGPRIAGRAVSGHGFLKALAHADPARPVVLYGDSLDQLDRFTALQDRDPMAVPGQEVCWAQSFDDPRLRQAGALHVHGLAKVTELAWRRARGDDRAVSLIGLNHTISTHDAQDALGAYLTAPVQPWDAIVCTSRASRAAIEQLFDDYGGYLARRFGAARVPRPHLEVIPLGIWCDEYAVPAAKKARLRAQWRARLGIADADPVALHFGRLTHLGKAHPTAGFLALQRARESLGRPVHLVLAGWFANDGIEDEYREAARRLCPDVRLHVLDGRDDAVRFSIWHAADLFVSLSDTIQESFGITPLEAMAAGLPVLVSDWDGYRDTVPDGGPDGGEVGVRIPTLAPAPGDGQALSDWYEDGMLGIDGYEGFAALATAVDAGRLETALLDLLGAPDRLRAMGERAAAFARATVDWPVVLERHRALWAHLAEMRAAAPESAPLPHPLRPDPFRQFAGHPTRALTPELRLSRRPDRSDTLVGDLSALSVHRFAEPVIGFTDVAQGVLARLSAGDATVGELTAGLQGPPRQQMVWTVGFLLKLGLIQAHPPC